MTPFTDKQNEELLRIVFSMLLFTQAETTELMNARAVLKGSLGKGT